MVVCIPAIPTLGRLRQEDQEFEAGLGYKTRPCLNLHLQEKIKKTQLLFQEVGVDLRFCICNKFLGNDGNAYPRVALRQPGHMTESSFYGPSG
jgi:hypothetical protein